MQNVGDMRCGFGRPFQLKASCADAAQQDFGVVTEVLAEGTIGAFDPAAHISVLRWYSPQARKVGTTFRIR